VRVSDGEYLPERRLERDEALLAELVGGASVKAAAERSGTPLATAHRRFRDERFRGRLDEGRRLVMAGVATRLAGSAELALDVLVDVAGDEAVAPSVRVKAALGLLAAASAYHERQELVANLSSRLEVLEAEVAVRERRPSRFALEAGE
jgi:hypothetical protein